MARVNNAQKQFLIQFVEKHADILFGRFSNSSGSRTKNKLWTEMNDKLNELGPPTKNISNWKQVYKL